MKVLEKAGGTFTKRPQLTARAVSQERSKVPVVVGEDGGGGEEKMNGEWGETQALGGPGQQLLCG